MQYPPATVRRFLLLAALAGVAAVILVFTIRRGHRPLIRHFVYREDVQDRLGLDVYLPPDGKAGDRRPCVVWFFGGGWEFGAPSQYAKHSDWLARRGVVAITPDYRVKSRHGSRVTPFDALEDSRSAMRWIRQHSAELGVDPERIAAAGGSSGGHLALSCAVIPRDPDRETRTSVSCIPNALILFNPVVDFEIPYVRRKTSPADRERLAEISPLLRMSGPLPPTLVFHGTSDSIIPIQSSEALVFRAKEWGSERVDLIRYPGKGHEFHLPGPYSRREFSKSLGESFEFLESIGWLKVQ